MTSIWERFQESRVRARFDTLIARGQRDQLERLLETHCYRASLVELLVQNRSSIAIELLVAGYRNGEIAKWYLDDLLKGPIDPDIRSKLQCAIQERTDYLAESLFHNTVRYENEKLAAYMQKLTSKARK